jgi:hypothetical protein
MSLRADPCADVVRCKALNWRDHTDPQPTRCPVCGGELLHPPPTGLTALRAAEAARVLGEQGEAS